LGLAEVPVVVLDHLSETQRRAYILADNKLAMNAGWDEKMLASELARTLLMMIEDEPRPRASSDTRQALTVALLKPGRGASLNQAMNSYLGALLRVPKPSAPLALWFWTSRFVSDNLWIAAYRF
jgi:hypothetical protein